MTREERQKAVDALKISTPFMAVTQEEFNDYIQIRNQVMDWLEQEPCEDAVSRQAVLETIDVCNSDGLKGIFCSYDDGERFKAYIKGLPPVTPKQQTCEDAISRQEALNCVTSNEFRYRMVEDMKALPPVIPQPKTGHWVYDEKLGVYRCSCFTDLTRTNAYKYCSNCGRKMVSE